MATLIDPRALVEEGAKLGNDCRILAGAVITRHAVLGDRVTVHPGAVVGGEPQYLKFDPETPSEVRVGDDTVIRENVTVNRGLKPGSATVVGARCYLMANAHAGHDCELADDVVLANNVMLAGHVTVGAFTFVGGGVGIHQFARIGASCMVAGLARVTVDQPPFTMIAERDELIGLNLVGLKRRGVAREAIAELKALFRAVYGESGNIREVAARWKAQVKSGEGAAFLEFFAGGKRGFARPRRERSRDKVEGGDA